MSLQPISTVYNSLHYMDLSNKRENLKGEEAALFLAEHSELVGVRKYNNYDFNIDAFEDDKNLLRTIKIRNIDDYVLSFFKYKPVKDCKILLESFLEYENWSEIDATISSLTPQRAKLLKGITSDKFVKLKKNSYERTISMIMAFPKINWVKALWEPSIWHEGKDRSFMDHWIDKDTKKPLFVYSSVKGRDLPEIEKELNPLFVGLHAVFCNTIFRKLSIEISYRIIEDVILAAHPILASAPEFYGKFNDYCVQVEKDCNKKIAHLAHREFRQNNGLCAQVLTKVEKKDIHEMFMECFSVKSITYDPYIWRGFIEEIGKDREVDQPRLKKGEIVKTITKISDTFELFLCFKRLFKLKNTK